MNEKVEKKFADWIQNPGNRVSLLNKKEMGEFLSDVKSVLQRHITMNEGNEKMGALIDAINSSLDKELGGAKANLSRQHLEVILTTAYQNSIGVNHVLDNVKKMDEKGKEKSSMDETLPHLPGIALQEFKEVFIENKPKSTNYIKSVDIDANGTAIHNLCTDILGSFEKSGPSGVSKAQN